LRSRRGSSPGAAVFSILIMTIVETISHAPEDFRRDTITLTWEERRQGHGRRRSDGGVEFAISLPSGTVLKGGDVLALLEEQVAVIVREAPEPVYVIRPKTPQEWAYFSYHVGNRHQPVMIGASELIFPRNPAVQSLLDQLHAQYETDSRAFTAAVVSNHAH
jgi:urease accessory protein